LTKPFIENKTPATRRFSAKKASKTASNLRLSSLSLSTPIRNSLPPITYPQELPVCEVRSQIAQAILEHQVVIICGETGSGKTTQLPKICLELGRGTSGLIGHTQPRRLAATSVARRLAQELNTELGVIVGYQIRFTEQIKEGAWVKLMTDGILLAETQADPDLRHYDTLIIDEAHERSLNIDFLLGYLKHLLARRPDLKIIITSATIDAEKFSQHFASRKGNAPVINVSGRLFPVELRYAPLLKDEELNEAICRASDELMRAGPGDILVFLPGEREIKEASEALRKHHFAGSTALHASRPELMPLFARLSAQDQQRVFSPSPNRRIVLATNVAETSLTVPGIRYVIDSGLARVKRYSFRNKVEQLGVESISQAAANQRAGRCGRVAAGICIRLYDEEEFAKRPKFTDPEILRSSLASVVLRMKALRLVDIEFFPFIDPPIRRAIADGYALLQELGALDERNHLTALGRQLAKLPVDPKIGRMILAGAEHQALKEVLIIASALSTQDPRDRPAEKQNAADEAHKKFADEKSEFCSLLKLWEWFSERLAHKQSHRKFIEECRANFVNFLRLREWRDVHSQLVQLVHEAGLRENTAAATYEQLHTALLTGLLGNIGCKTDEDATWLGARGIRFLPHPGVMLTKKPGKWLIAAELVETTRLYGRNIAHIEPPWIERVAKHLIVKAWSEPRWDPKSLQVVANERGTLYGILIYHGRRVSYVGIDAGAAREIFIREALATREWETPLPFFAHNNRLIREIEAMEHKARRPDFLVDEDLLYQFYDSQLPAEVNNAISFERWYREKSKTQDKLLFLSKEDILKRDITGITYDAYPKKLILRTLELKLDYHFEPGSLKDGVTLTVPVFALNQVDGVVCEWLVPGMLKEKVTALLKSLPPKVRHRLQPLADTSTAFIEQARVQAWPENRPLIEALRDFSQEKTGLQLLLTDFKVETLAAHHFMNYRVIDEHGRMLDAGRNLAHLRALYGNQAQLIFSDHATQQASETLDIPERFTDWTFGPLPELIEMERSGKVLIGFPAFRDEGEFVTLEVLDDENAARAMHKSGLRRLFMLKMKDQLRALEKNSPNISTVAMQARSYSLPYSTASELLTEIIEATFDRAFLQEPWPMDANSFQKQCDAGKGRVTLIAQEILRLLQNIVAELGNLQKKMALLKPFPGVLQDIQGQIASLFPKRFICETPVLQLSHYPRYIKALNIRIDKLKTDPTRDARLQTDFLPLQIRYQKQKAAHKGQMDRQLDELRWLLEELRVGLFAQELKTPTPVSVKRILKVFESLNR